MTAKTPEESYINSVAISKANEVLKTRPQSDADYVYDFYMQFGWRLWNDLRRTLPWKDAMEWLRKYFEETPAKPRLNVAHKSVIVPGAECWAKYTVDEYNSILKKVDDSLSGNKSESKRKMQLKTAVNNAWIFVKVKPDIYDVNRHGEWISESKFSSMLKTMKEIISKYEVVPTTQIAA